MILNCAGVMAPRRTPPRIMCMTSNVGPEQLRTQLDQLHTEAEKTRAKANNARLRLMRLSEAAEKLQRQAVLKLETRKEDDARELLFQKKKIIQALEKSNGRIKLLDELSTKLNEAISVKETQLIDNVALELNVEREDASIPVHIISPKEEPEDESNGSEDLDQIATKHNQDLQCQAQFEPNIPISDQQGTNEERIMCMDMSNEEDPVFSLKGISTYEEFLGHLDRQLNKIENELVIVLRLSTLVLEREKPKNFKLQQTEEILVNVRAIRGRIASIMHTKLEVQ